LDIQSYVAGVPEMERFFTVDELNVNLERIAAEHPDLATLTRVGTSKLGEPISMLSIGHGPKNAFLFGCPHPNEPIGSNLIHYVSNLLCDDADLRDGLGYTWRLIPSVDPDGTRLNEGWFGGPFTIRNYARHFYRPSSEKQVEWTFPVSYKKLYFDASLPETEMLMRVIDDLKPELMASLHNAGFGGVYYYLSRPADPMYETLYTIPKWEGLPLRLGEAETPWAIPFAPAIFPMLTIAAGYDYTESNGGDPIANPSGTSSFEYSQRHGTFSIVTEVAYFDDPRVNDETPTETLRRDAVLGGVDISEEGATVLRAHFDAVAKQLKGNSPFQESVDWWARLSARNEAVRNWARTDPDMNRPASVAELFSNNQERQFYRLLGLGMLLRMLEGEIGIGNGTPLIRQHLTEATATFDEWAEKLDASLNMRVVPIRKLVGVQLGAILAAGRHLAEQRGRSS
jgi:hypothetical protein